VTPSATQTQGTGPLGDRMARSAKGVLYRTPDLAQDFLLMPRDSPHFAGSWNPTAISMLFEDEGKVRTIEAR
jgi:hypothetical protein